jgi:enamine deaminase RidA (YjgF/YER057c/UK114 family)
MIQTEPSMMFHTSDCGDIPTEVSISCFQGQSGVEEYHLMVSPTEYGGIADQLEWVFNAYQRALRSVGLEQGTCVFRRFLCSDLSNQASVMEGYPFANPLDPDEPCAVSWVCQPPAAPAKVVLWAYHVSDPGGALTKGKQGTSLRLSRGDLTHLWTTGLTCTEVETSYGQTESILYDYERTLQAEGLRLADHVIRTWFFVRDVDTNYHGLVKARKQFFSERGLAPDTHFIASTGIEGRSAGIVAKVLMDAYAISGVQADQIQFLSAPDHLSPTHIYGVTFERGVSVAYQDRKHVIISGTASIDNAGKIVHPGDVLRQLDRTLENLGALLHEADAAFRDVCMFIVYVRDQSDLGVARRVMRDRFGDIPLAVVVAPVCRPGWLIEIECQAIVPTSNPTLPAF